MLSSILSCILFLCVIDSALGHVSMQKPYPLRSPHNPNEKSGPKDYDMSSPLAPNGSNYPCKGYNKDISGVASVETYTAGQTYSITLQGSATHMGGSCQISLSYDNGATFKVIHSMIGGCPLKTSYDFTIPKDAPNGKKTILAWTWFNKVGNREMYMNCAVVDIVGGSDGKTLNTPEIFRANTFAGTCITPEGKDLVFENPGDSVEYGGDYATNKPSGPTPITGCSNAPPPPPSQDQPTNTNITTTQQGQPITTENTFPTTMPAPVPTTTPTTQPAPTTIESQPTTQSTCDDLTTTITQIVTQTITQTQTEVVTITKDSSETKLSRTVRPTTTQDIVTPTSEPCNKEEAIQCYENGKKWKFCDGTEWVDMGLCSKGQTCKDGKLVNPVNED
ncbi:hypothetical protein L211DRAFT_781976 [Terfezia boudieri ATCC MYA-4762]|uniref:Chitin-binding type-4 domain-containing protein n=1 Tax=Terfezia boudieri ATCC MYA-4762 TaxID=1051890 RepID=A0A3N4LT77_9PEZI|nr:hypothetical protein L211DRAFT_781976 [Terfezia boudieri ATCC MYA-4762]